jgi:threonine dehydratase
MRPELRREEVVRLCRTRYDAFLDRILTAQVYEAAIETPLERASTLSAQLGREVWFKREDLQPVFSFKIRGALNKIASLDAQVRARGVIAASAGNHAQGVAVAARLYGCRAVIVMPAATPEIKVEAVRRQGGEVVLHGEAFQEAYTHAVTLGEAEGLTFVHPYDDPEVIAGQGTIAVELLRQHPGKIEAVFVPIGGGGLASGVALYLKRLYPDLKVIGVEPVDAACMHAALEAGERVVLPDVGRFADGAAVRQAGALTYEICRDLLDEVLLVDTDQICAAIKAVFGDTRSILEPAGALGVAGLRRWVAERGGGEGALIAVTSGANMNFDRLRFVAERAEIGVQREAWLCVTIPERPGAFRALSAAFGGRNVTEFNYRYAALDEAHVFVGVDVRGREESALVMASIRGAGFACLDLSDNEVAKTHIKHMVGGRSPDVLHERIFRFRFPERAGALRRFLDALPAGFNISLFHYRNQGGDVASVLAGIQVPPELGASFDAFLVALAYPYVEETHNPACRFFL